jgi:hypothetical protein
VVRLPIEEAFGFGLNSVSSFNLVPMPPQRIIVGIVVLEVSI